MFRDVLANLLSACVIALVGILVYYIFSLVYRARLLKFFGITERSSTVQCYVSRLFIDESMSKGAEGEEIRRGYVGPAINRNEYIGACEICALFRFKLLAILPRKVRDVLSRRGTALLPVQCRIDTSPESADLYRKCRQSCTAWYRSIQRSVWRRLTARVVLL